MQHLRCGSLAFFFFSSLLEQHSTSSIMWSNHSQTTKAPGSLQEACHAQPGVLSTALARTALPQRAVQRCWSSRTPHGHDGAPRSADRGHDGAPRSAVEAHGALSSVVRAPGAHCSAWLRGGLKQQPLQVCLRNGELDLVTDEWLKTCAFLEMGRPRSGVTLS